MLSDAIVEGARLAAGFNPLYSLVGSVAAAMLLARKPGPLRITLAAAAVGACWFLGDGIAVLAYARDATAGSGAATALWLELAIWTIGGIALGYALPVWAGVFVGRRVTFGTGWASAGVIAATTSGLVSAMAGRLGG